MIGKTSTIGVDDIPAYKVEYDDVLSDDISKIYATSP